MAADQILHNHRDVLKAMFHKINIMAAKPSHQDILNIVRKHKEILRKAKYQSWPIQQKLESVRLAKAFVERYEGRLSRGQGYQERGAKVWRRFKREYVNFISFFVPWETRFKKIESHFGSAVSSYFTFLRWLFWVNILLAVLTLSFVVLPEAIVGAPFGSSPQKSIPEDELDNALDFQTVFNYQGYLEYSVMFYGFYGSEESIGKGYRMPLAYFLTFFALIILSFIIILRKMASNSRTSRLASKDEQYTFSWKLFTSWDFLIGNYDTAINKAAEILNNLKESILEEKEKTRDEKRSLLICLRILAHFLVVLVLAGSSFATIQVIQYSETVDAKVLDGYQASWIELNAVTVVLTVITSLFPNLFDVISLLEKYHPRVSLRWQLARVLALYLLNMLTMFFGLYQKVNKQWDDYTKNKQILANYTLACNSTSRLDIAINATTSAPFNVNCTNSTIENIKQPMMCWETMIGGEFVSLTVFDLIFTIGTIILIDFVRGLVVRYFNPCCCWDMEKKFPEYGEFKLAENLLHLINNQGVIWMGTFFAPCLPAINVIKLVCMLYIRSWAVNVCNIPPERVFKASQSNNFYYAILLFILFISLIPVVFMMVFLQPSPDCGPLSEYKRHYYVLTETIEKECPEWLNTVISYVASPGVIIPVILLFVMALYYLISLTRSLKEANSDLRSQLLYERTEEKRKIYAMADAKSKEKGKGEKNLHLPSNQQVKNREKIDMPVRVVEARKTAKQPMGAVRDSAQNIARISHAVEQEEQQLAMIQSSQLQGTKSSVLGERRSPPVAVVRGKPMNRSHLESINSNSHNKMA